MHENLSRMIHDGTTAIEAELEDHRKQSRDEMFNRAPERTERSARNDFPKQFAIVNPDEPSLSENVRSFAIQLS